MSLRRNYPYKFHSGPGLNPGPQRGSTQYANHCNTGAKERMHDATRLATKTDCVSVFVSQKVSDCDRGCG